MQKVLISNVASQVGRFILKHLSHYNSEIEVIAGLHQDAFEHEKELIIDRNVNSVVLPMNQSGLKDSLKEIDKLVLLQTGTNYYSLNKELVNAAKSTNVKFILLISALDVGMEDEKNYPLEMQVRQLEELIIKSQVPYSFLRTSMFCQQLLRFAKHLNKGVLPLPLKEDKPFRLLHLDDLSRAATAILLTSGTRHGKIFYLCGKEAITAQELAQKLSKFLDRSIAFKEVSFDEEKKIILGSGIIEDEVEPWLEFFHAVSNDKEKDSPDFELLTLEERSSIDEFIVQHAEDFVLGED